MVVFSLGREKKKLHLLKPKLSLNEGRGERTLCEAIKGTVKFYIKGTCVMHNMMTIVNKSVVYIFKLLRDLKNSHHKKEKFCN